MFSRICFACLKMYLLCKSLTWDWFIHCRYNVYHDLSYVEWLRQNHLEELPDCGDEFSNSEGEKPFVDFLFDRSDPFESFESQLCQLFTQSPRLASLLHRFHKLLNHSFPTVFPLFSAPTPIISTSPSISPTTTYTSHTPPITSGSTPPAPLHPLLPAPLYPLRLALLHPLFLAPLRH